MDYTRLYNQTLLNESQAMTNILNAHVVYRSDIVQMITLAALIGAFFAVWFDCVWFVWSIT